MLEEGLCDSCVSLLKMVGTGFARKNLAVALARFSKAPPFLARMREIGATRLLLELQAELL